MPFRSLHMTFYTLVGMVMLLAGSLIFSTSLLIRPLAIHYNGAEVTFVRETPFGEVLGEWSTEIRVAATGRECSSGTHLSTYQEEPNNTVNWRLGVWAAPCLEAGPPLVIVDTWRALLFGVIPIRPVQIVTVIDTADGAQAE